MGTFNIVASSNENTIVTEYIPDCKMSESY